jgi:hypothetical protein
MPQESGLGLVATYTLCLAQFAQERFRPDANVLVLIDEEPKRTRQIEVGLVVVRLTWDFCTSGSENSL